MHRAHRLDAIDIKLRFINTHVDARAALKLWDTLAVILPLANEPSQERLLEQLDQDPQVLISWGAAVKAASELARNCSGVDPSWNAAIVNEACCEWIATYRDYATAAADALIVAYEVVHDLGASILRGATSASRSPDPSLFLTKAWLATRPRWHIHLLLRLTPFWPSLIDLLTNQRDRTLESVGKIIPCHRHTPGR